LLSKPTGNKIADNTDGNIVLQEQNVCETTVEPSDAEVVDLDEHGTKQAVD